LAPSTLTHPHRLRRHEPTTATPRAPGTASAVADGWQELLTACWGEIAAQSGPLLRRSSKHEVLAYVGALLSAVEHALIDQVHAPKASCGSEPRGGIWCAAQALDASALAWHAARPAAERRFVALGARLQQQVSESPRPELSAASVAATVRTASDALEQLALGAPRQEAALRALEDAAIALAAIAVQSWTAAQLRPPASRMVDRTLTIHRLAAQVATAAAFEARAAGGVGDTTAGWLAAAIAEETPAASLALIDDPRADRVRGAEALSIARAAWITRAALELLAVQRLDREANVVPRRRLRAPAHAAAAARAAARPATTVPARSIATWRRHALALARPVASYLRACEARDGLFGDTRERLLDLLADSLAEASRLDARLNGERNLRTP
jgi:uncharacterized protein YdbL (DUF1318 family)